MRHRSTCTKSERGKPFKTSLSLQLLPAPAYSGEETGRMMVKLSSTTQIIDLLSHLSHNLPQEARGKSLLKLPGRSTVRGIPAGRRHVYIKQKGRT